MYPRNFFVRSSFCLFKRESSINLWSLLRSGYATKPYIKGLAPKKPRVDFEFPCKKYITAHLNPEKGNIYDIKPFKYACEKDKLYMWCACGYSKNQPFCDGTHKSPHGNCETTLRPVKFIAPETKEYWFCNCKQTTHRPFCDGSHKKAEVKEAYDAANPEFRPPDRR